MVVESSVRMAYLADGDTIGDLCWNLGRPTRESCDSEWCTEGNPEYEASDVSEDDELIDGSAGSPTQPATRKRRLSIRYFSPWNVEKNVTAHGRTHSPPETVANYVFSADNGGHGVDDLFELVFGGWNVKQTAVVETRPVFAARRPHDGLTSVLWVGEKTFETGNQVVVGDFAAVRDHEVAHGFQTQFVREGGHDEVAVRAGTPVERAITTSKSRHQRNTNANDTRESNEIVQSSTYCGRC